jgi:hypothetical protein
LEQFKERDGTPETQQRNLNSPAKGAASGVRNQTLEFAPSHAAGEKPTILKEAEMMELQEAIMQGIKELQRQQQETTRQGIKELQRQQQETTMQIIRALQQPPQATNPLEYIKTAEDGTNEIAPNELITKLKTSKRMNETPENPHVPDNRPSKPYMKYIEEPSMVRAGKQSTKFREVHIRLDKEVRALQSDYDEDIQEIKRLDFRTELTVIPAMFLTT